MRNAFKARPKQNARTCSNCSKIAKNPIFSFLIKKYPKKCSFFIFARKTPPKKLIFSFLFEKSLKMLFFHFLSKKYPKKHPVFGFDQKNTPKNLLFPLLIQKILLKTSLFHFSYFDVIVLCILCALIVVVQDETVF